MSQTFTTLTTVTTGPVSSTTISTSAGINPLAPDGGGQEGGDNIPSVNLTRREEQQMRMGYLSRGASASDPPAVLDIGAVPDAQ
jgi:hypothetical protein